MSIEYIFVFLGILIGMRIERIINFLGKPKGSPNAGAEK